jgi:hypothetical protein
MATIHLFDEIPRCGLKCGLSRAHCLRLSRDHLQSRASQTEGKHRAPVEERMRHDGLLHPRL